MRVPLDSKLTVEKLAGMCLVTRRGMRQFYGYGSVDAVFGASCVRSAIVKLCVDCVSSCRLRNC